MVSKEGRARKRRLNCKSCTIERKVNLPKSFLAVAVWEVLLKSAKCRMAFCERRLSLEMLLHSARAYGKRPLLSGKCRRLATGDVKRPREKPVFREKLIIT